jgi:hypothetical protein
MRFLPVFIYENNAPPQLGDQFFVIPEKDSVIAEYMDVSEVTGNSFVAGGYRFLWTGSVGHVGSSAMANAYDSIAAYHAVKLLPKFGWTQHTRRRDVFYREYINKKLAPPLRRTAYIQIDHRNGKFLIVGTFLGEGQNMLAELSESFDLEKDYHSAALKICNYIERADGIILASYAMNVTKESALGMAQRVRGENFDRGAE